MNYSIVVNGLGHAFLREFGCPCARCRQGQRMANTSASIIATDEENGKIIWHALVDVGLGVVTSLCDLATPDDARLDWLLFTHWHPDHSLVLNRLCETLRRRARLRAKSVTKLPTWCRRGTAGNRSAVCTPQHAGPYGHTRQCISLFGRHRSRDLHRYSLRKRLLCCHDGREKGRPALGSRQYKRLDRQPVIGCASRGSQATCPDRLALHRLCQLER